MCFESKFQNGWKLLTKNIPTNLEYLGNFYDCEIYIKLDYQTHPHVSGNKWRKLKYNLLEAKKLNCKYLLTCGGAYSNHLIATASAGYELGFQTVGIVRGNELSENANNTLKRCKAFGMELIFVSRCEYNKRYSADFWKPFLKKYDPAYVIPEGGTNHLALKGILELSHEINLIPDYICCSVGTAGTLIGLSLAFPQTTVVGFLSLKAANFEKVVREQSIQLVTVPIENFILENTYHFGGYGKYTPELVEWMKTFEYPLDKIYTSKMVYGLFDSLKKNKIFNKGSKIVIYHSGGLQGN
jgi:1-aminocyclopropane-1-carboxylate deaminase